MLMAPELAASNFFSTEQALANWLLLEGQDREMLNIHALHSASSNQGQLPHVAPHNYNILIIYLRTPVILSVP